MEDIKKLKKFWKNKKVFITGHTGFKGSWMCIVLNILGAKIYGYALKPEKNSLFNQANCSNIVKKNFFFNINNQKQLNKKIAQVKPDLLFHLAAQPLVSESFLNPIETFNTNVIGTLNILNAIKNNKSLKSVVIITTDKVYKIKNKNKYYDENDELGGKDPYSSSKVCAEIITYSYIDSFFKKTNLKNKISTARAGNVIGGGDFSQNRLIPDIIYAINNKKKLNVRNPDHVRPWQHVLDPLMGYLILAKKQYTNKVDNKEHAWNFGPNKNNFKKVIDIVKYIRKLQYFKFSLFKITSFKETNVLKLDSIKAKKKLNWFSKWNLTQSLEKTLEWNENTKKGISAKDMCERQFLMYLNKK